MQKKTLYQTVEDRDNPDEIEEKGPFACKRSNAWLGEGYYFWDTFIELAHWWGESSYKGNYVICQSFCDKESSATYDLYDDLDLLRDFRSLKENLENQDPRREIMVKDVIHFLKYHSDFTSEYKAIRANAVNCWRDVPAMKFASGKSAYLELCPPIQICVIDKSYLLDGKYEIVYPEKYVSPGEVV